MVLFMNSSVFVEDVKDPGEDFNNKVIPPHPPGPFQTPESDFGELN